MTAGVLVMGGRFVGLAAADKLARSDGGNLAIQLLDRRRRSIFSPMLPDLISHRIRPQHISYPLLRHCRRLGIRFNHANVESIDPKAMRIRTDKGALSCDYLIICLGCQTNYFGNEAARTHALALKSPKEGLAIARKTLHLLAGSRQATIIVVGGGYTGFEAASHIAYLLHTHTRFPYRRLEKVARVFIA